jgi:DNA-damage-inducible protein J
MLLFCYKKEVANMKQAVTRVEDAEYELFQKTATSLGTTPSDALRMFIYAFNDHHGFPYAVQSRRMQVEAFETEEEATEFATNLAEEIMS